MSEDLEIEIYPLRRGERLPAQWVPLHFQRVRDSRWRAVVDAEARAYGFDLWCAACSQDPAGTLPVDDLELAMLAGLARDRETWERVREGALYGWRRVVCTDDEDEFVRLAHPMVTGVVVEAMGRFDASRKKRDDNRDRVRMWRVRNRLREAGAAERLTKHTPTISRVVAWLDERSLRITVENVTAAVEALNGADERIVPFPDGGMSR